MKNPKYRKNWICQICYSRYKIEMCSTMQPCHLFESMRTFCYQLKHLKKPRSYWIGKSYTINFSNWTRGAFSRVLWSLLLMAYMTSPLHCYSLIEFSFQRLMQRLALKYGRKWRKATKGLSISQSQFWQLYKRPTKNTRDE